VEERRKGRTKYLKMGLKFLTDGKGKMNYYLEEECRLFKRSPEGPKLE